MKLTEGEAELLESASVSDMNDTVRLALGPEWSATCRGQLKIIGSPSALYSGLSWLVCWQKVAKEYGAENIVAVVEEAQTRVRERIKAHAN